LTLKGRSRRTIKTYVGWVKKLSGYYGQSPDTITGEQTRGFLFSLHERGLAGSTINQAVNALRYFYREVLRRSDEQLRGGIPRPRAAKKLHRAYSPGQISTLLDAARGDALAYAFLSTLYHTGMRLDEGCHLKFSDIERDHGRILVRQGKGKKDRYTLFPEKLELDLDQYYRRYRRRFGTALPWLFLGKRQSNDHLVNGSAQHLFYKYRGLAGLPNLGGIHTLRHSFATHQLMMGIGIEELRGALGHRSLLTTIRYLHSLSGCHHLYERRCSPLDTLLRADAEEGAPQQD
jgi:site-specific recombinase XerD